MPDDFAPSPALVAATPAFAGTAVLDAERLDCYRLAVEFQALATGRIPKRGHGGLRDQLDRASISIALNIAFYSIARGSATECAAIVDVIASRGLIAPSLCRQARGQLVRLVQMLTRLNARMAARPD